MFTQRDAIEIVRRLGVDYTIAPRDWAFPGDLAVKQELTCKNGDTSTGSRDVVQQKFGYNGTSEYPHFITTRHNTSAALNAFEFYTCDGTKAGVFPTNAVLGLTIENGDVTIAGDLTVGGGTPWEVPLTFTSPLSRSVNTVSFDFSVANTFTAAQTIDVDDIRETLSGGITFANDTNAAMTYDQFTPYFRLYSKGWDGTVGTKYVVGAFMVAPEGGTANPVGVLKWFYGANTTTPVVTNELMRLEWGERLGATFNDLGLAGYKFRVAGNTVANLLTTDGATDRVGIRTNTPSAALHIDADVLRLAAPKTPASASDTGSIGDICWDGLYIYVCVNTNQWKRTAISTW